MPKTAYHPNAYLTHKRNVKNGLSARTRILLALEKSPLDAKNIAHASELSYAAVMHHLRLLKTENVVEHTKGRKYVW